MKKLGLVGGTGPESTLVYYREINRLVNEKTDGKIFPELALESVNLYKALDLVGSEKYKELQNYLFNSIHNLVDGGAEVVALTAVTMHVIYDELKDQISVPFISIPETVSEVAVRRGYKKVGLLGTIFTMEKDYMKKAFLEKGIEVITPSLDTMQLVNERIINELEHGIVKDATRDELIHVVEQMKKEDGIEAIILGCTELPLALNDDNCTVDCLDVMDIHIKRLVELAME